MDRRGWEPGFLQQIATGKWRATYTDAKPEEYVWGDEANGLSNELSLGYIEVGVCLVH